MHPNRSEGCVIYQGPGLTELWLELNSDMATLRKN